MSLPAFGVGDVERLSEVLGLQVLNGMISKSLVVAVNDWELRVCGMKVLIQLVNPSDRRFTLPSISSFVSMHDDAVQVPIGPVVVPLVVRQAQPPQATGPGPAGVSLGPPFVTALIASRGTPGAHPPAGIGLHTLLGSPLPAPGHDGLVAGPLASKQAISW